MSHSTAKVKFSDDQVWFGEWNNTSDTYCSRIFSTEEARNDKWRSFEWNQCACGGEEPVVLETDGTHYLMLACRKCRSLCPDYAKYADACWDDLTDGIINLTEDYWDRPVSDAVALVDAEYRKFERREGKYKYY